MRILVVGNNHRAEIRAATVVHYGLARALRDRGHEVTFLQAALPLHREPIPGVRMRYTGVTRKSLYPLLFGLRTLSRFDVIHTHDQAGAYLALRSRVQRIPLVAEFHPAVVHHESFWRSGWRWRYIGIAAGNAPMILAPSVWLRDELQARYRLEPARLHAIPNGIGDHWFEPGRERPSQAERPLRVIVVNMKGVNVALDAFARVARQHALRLEVYGVHRDVEIYRKRAEQRGISKLVDFVGFVHNRGLPQRIAGADVLLHAARSESFGQVLAEAAALGIPAVCSRVGAIPEVVETGRTGLLCAVGAVDEFAAALATLVSNPALRAKMSEAAAARARELWRWSTVVKRIEEEVYTPLTSR